MRILLAICALSSFPSSVISYVGTVVARFGTTDGLFWLNHKLFFVDTYAHQLCSYRPQNGAIYCATIGTGLISFAVPLLNHPSSFVVGSSKYILIVEWDSDTDEANPHTTEVAAVDLSIPGNRISYGGVDPRGRLWFGTMINPPGKHGLNLGSVWTFSSGSRRLTKQIRHVSLSSGFVFNLALDPPKIYYIDSLTYKIVAYSYHSIQGIIGEPEVIYDFFENRMRGLPARLTIDERGWLWVPLFGGSLVVEIDPFTKSKHRSIKINAAGVSACTFGGPYLRTLFVSTMGHGAHAPRGQYDFGGHIFAISGLGVKGVPTTECMLE